MSAVGTLLLWYAESCRQAGIAGFWGLQVLITHSWLEKRNVLNIHPLEELRILVKSDQVKMHGKKFTYTENNT
jgi:hypothetical protein